VAHSAAAQPAPLRQVVSVAAQMLSIRRAAAKVKTLAECDDWLVATGVEGKRGLVMELTRG